MHRDSTLIIKEYIQTSISWTMKAHISTVIGRIPSRFGRFQSRPDSFFTSLKKTPMQPANWRVHIARPSQKRSQLEASHTVRQWFGENVEAVFIFTFQHFNPRPNQPLNTSYAIHWVQQSSCCYTSSILEKIFHFSCLHRLFALLIWRSIFDDTGTLVTLTFFAS